MSEEQSDKSGTDPEDSEENFSQADINDYHHYEQIFRPRQRELNRTPTQDDEEFQAPDCSEPESLPTVPAPPPPVVAAAPIQRPAHLKVRKSSKKPSPSPTRRASQPGPPSQQVYSGSPVRLRKGSNPTTPTSAGCRPIFEGQPASPTRYYRPPTSPMLSSRRRSSSVQSRFIAVSTSYPIFEFRFLNIL